MLVAPLRQPVGLTPAAVVLARRAPRVEARYVRKEFHLRVKSHEAVQALGGLAQEVRQPASIMLQHCLDAAS